MIAQVYLVRDQYSRMDWVRYDKKPKPGDHVVLDGETWFVKEVYTCLSDNEVHFSRKSKAGFGSCFEER